MKKISICALIFVLPACSPVLPTEYNQAEKVCATHGGVKNFTSTWSGVGGLNCNDGSYFRDWVNKK